MDFDDLDDAIEQRIAEGDMDGLTNLAGVVEATALKAFTGNLPPVPYNKGLPPVTELTAPSSAIKMRAFVFYGPGEKTDLFHFTCVGQPKWLELAVYEYPGHGSRSGEAVAENLDDLAKDCYDSMSPALEQVVEGAEYEGAPFAFIARSSGVQLMTAVSKMILLKLKMSPCSVIVMDRAPPHVPMLTPKGKELLENEPDKVVKAYNYSDFEWKDKKLFASDLAIADTALPPLSHKFDCDVTVMKGDIDALFANLADRAHRFKPVSLKIKGSNKSFSIPVEPSAKVETVTNAVRKIFAYKASDTIKACSPEGKDLPGDAKVPSTLVFDGLDDFEHPRHSWEHPVVIIGGGFMGVKMGMQYMLHKNENIVLFDRHKKAGGDAWHLSATKFSRCQTDFGAFNIWYGQEFNYTGDKGFGSNPTNNRAKFTASFKGPGAPPEGSGAGTGVDYHPVREQILEGMRHAIGEYGFTKHCHFESDVTSLKIVGEPDDENRYYELGITPLGGSSANQPWTMKASVIYHFPGAYDVTRLIDYPGEDSFIKAGGQIGYGMGNGQGGQFVWDDGRMKDSRAVILGNGAFAVENVRSCVENAAAKVYIITRRKSLLCPRLPCWFCHQGNDPTPAGFLLNMFKPMYAAAGIEDPWKFYAVVGSDENDCAIKQSSRFGIGDVTFLCHAFGLLEYRVGTLDRCNGKTLHLSSGDKLEDIDHICKALGLLGDAVVDKFHGMTHRIGSMINGDWRRVVSADATGMDARRFSTFSAGPAASGFTKTWYYLHNHPWEFRKAAADGMLNLMPKHVLSDTQPDQPIYMANIQYEMWAGGIFGSYFPGMGRAMGDEGSYKHCLVQTMHPAEKFFEYCKADWDRYQNMFRKQCQGCADKWVEYPYTMDMIEDWFTHYNNKLNLNIKVSGPSDYTKYATIEEFKDLDRSWQADMIPALLAEYGIIKDVKTGEDPYLEHLASQIKELKTPLAASDPFISPDFSSNQYDDWKDWVSDGHTCRVEKVASAQSESLLRSPESWGKIFKILGERLAQ